MDKQFINNKFKKFVVFLQKLENLASDSLNEFLVNLTNRTIPKSNPFNGLDLLKNWKVIQDEYDVIC